MKHKGKKKSPPCDSASKNNVSKNFQEKRSLPRRQGSKWHECNDDSDANFRSSLLNQGYCIKEMNADGNCLFRSLADQLSYHQRDSSGVRSSICSNMHVVVRQDVCNYLSQHKDEFQHFLLMEDDDEDVFNVDQYIERMRTDGQWGGNVEVVIASRAYKRNIKVFSGEYSNGVLSIENADNDRASKDDRHDCLEDLMLAYHGNDHYNSVIRLDNKQTTPLPLPSKGKTNSLNADDSNKCKDGYKNNQDDNAKGGIENRSKNNIDTRPLMRGSNCACGSGKKYKKCCMAKEKAKKRSTKFAAENHDSAKESGTSNHEKKDDTDDEYIGNFRVISI